MYKSWDKEVNNAIKLVTVDQRQLQLIPAALSIKQILPASTVKDMYTRIERLLLEKRISTEKPGMVVFNSEFTNVRWIVQVSHAKKTEIGVTCSLWSFSACMILVAFLLMFLSFPDSPDYIIVKWLRLLSYSSSQL